MLSYAYMLALCLTLVACSPRNTDEELPGREGSSLVFDLKWGGYYAMREGTGHYTVFRLMDFSPHTIHISIYRKTFVYRPSLEDVTELTPIMQFYAEDARILLDQREIHLLGYHDWTKDDIEGLRSYLIFQGAEVEAAEKRTKLIADLSKQPPKKLRLNLINDEVIITDP